MNYLNKYLFIIFNIFVISVILFSIYNYEYENHYCVATYHRNPTYQYLEVPSRLKHKYKLYNYKDRSLDRTESFNDGVPVLYVPGNAGSFKQVKALGSVIQRAYFHKAFDGKENKDEYELYYDKKLISNNHFDIFAIDYLAELSAFDGKILEDQAIFLNDCIKYILSLYKHRVNPPDSVILIGYSMGGIIARSVFTLDNYIKGSVRTIITINSPHLAAPILLEKNVKYFYDKVNNYWKNKKDNDELSQVALISIAGGWRDLKVRGGLSNLESITGNERVISTLTSSIPNVWVSNDHETSVWCNQLLASIASGLYHILDPNTSLPIQDVDTRMSRLRENFLSKAPKALGFEQTQTPEDSYKIDFIIEKYNLANAETVNTLKWVGENAEIFNSKYKWDLKDLGDNSQLHILTSVHPSRFHVFLCNQLNCYQLENFASLPYKYKGIRLRWTLKRLHFLTHDISNYSQLFIVPEDIEPSEDTHFIIVKLEKQPSNINIHANLMNEVQFHTQSKIIHNFTIPSISRFYAYHISVEKKDCSRRQIVNPIIMQYTEGMKEERYSVGNSILAKFHQSKYEDNNILWLNNKDNMHIVIFGDPFCEYTLRIKFSWADLLFGLTQMYMPLLPSLIFIILIILIYQQLNTNESIFPLLIKLVTSPMLILICLFASIISLVAPFLQNIHPIFASHSFKDSPRPDPTFIILLGLTALGYSIIVAIGSVSYVLLWIMNRINILSVNPKQSSTFKSNPRIIIILYLSLVTLTFLTHSAIPLGLSLVILIFPIYKGSVWKKHIVYLLLYLLYFGIMSVNLIIYLNNLNYEYRFIDSYELLTILIITHIILIKFTNLDEIQLDTPKISNLLLIACAQAIYFCIFPLYRIIYTGSFVVSVLIVNCYLKYQSKKNTYYDKEK